MRELTTDMSFQSRSDDISRTKKSGFEFATDFNTNEIKTLFEEFITKVNKRGLNKDALFWILDQGTLRFGINLNYAWLNCAENICATISFISINKTCI